MTGGGPAAPKSATGVFGHRREARARVGRRRKAAATTGTDALAATTSGERWPSPANRGALAAGHRRRTSTADLGEVELAPIGGSGAGVS